MDEWWCKVTVRPNPRSAAGSGWRRRSPRPACARSCTRRMPMVKFTGLTQSLGQLEESNADAQSNFWANLRMLGQPCFHFRFRRRGCQSGARPVREPPGAPRRADGRGAATADRRAGALVDGCQRVSMNCLARSVVERASVNMVKSGAHPCPTRSRTICHTLSGLICVIICEE
jgi:hypothetical protein